MLFNSIEFAVFLPIVFILYWFACHKSIRRQNALLVVASYFFGSSRIRVGGGQARARVSFNGNGGERALHRCAKPLHEVA